MPVRRTVLSLIPRHYYRTSVQRQIRCVGVLLQKPKKKESWFQPVQKYRDEIERWEVAKKQGKTFAQFKKEFEERKRKEMEKRRGEKGLDLTHRVKNQFQARFPRFSRLFFLIKDGVAHLYVDFMDMVPLYYNLWRKNRVIQDFNLRELELSYEIHLQLKKMIPVFVLAILPFGNIVVITITYVRPLWFLSPHFWTDEQKTTFIKQQHANRVAVFLPIIQYLDRNLPEKDNSKLFSKFRELLQSIQDGQVPNLTELASFKELFGGEQIFAMQKLSSSHLDNLLRLHGQKGFIMKGNRFKEWASYLHLVDRYIRRKGGVALLSSEQLAKYCFQRGVNANVMNEKEMQDYLKQWLAFSEHISSDYIALLMHAPALIGFNHKSNQSVTDD